MKEGRIRIRGQLHSWTPFPVVGLAPCRTQRGFATFRLAGGMLAKAAGSSGTFLPSVAGQSSVPAASTPYFTAITYLGLRVWHLGVAVEPGERPKAPCRTDSPPKPEGGREGYARWGPCPLPFPRGRRSRDRVIFLSFLCAFPSSFFPFDFRFTGCIFLLTLLPYFPQLCPHLWTLCAPPGGRRPALPSFPNLETPPPCSSPRPTGPCTPRGRGARPPAWR